MPKIALIIMFYHIKIACYPRQNGGRRESEIELGREEDVGGVMEIRGKNTNAWVKT